MIQQQYCITFPLRLLNFIVTMNSISSPVPHTSIPHAIIEDCDDHWWVCFEPDAAGIIVDEPQLISKSVVSQLCPHIVEKWDVQQEKLNIEAQRIEQKFITFTRQFNDTALSQPTPNLPDLGVACDEHLFPGMRRHWSEVAICATHPSDQTPFRVCKGCRINHQMKLSTSDDRHIVATRGARVPVCSDCATQAVQEYGVDYRGCVCNRQWTCYRCREIELVKLSKARSNKHKDGMCGRCLRIEELETSADICLNCHKLHTYA